MSRKAQKILTRLLGATLAVARDRCSTFEVATSIAAAVIVENQKRPFTPMATSMLGRILEEEPCDLCDDGGTR